jgi:3-oxoacyl-[acyl-carrier protein] reductase
MLKNKVAFLTGCNRGIGRALLETFAEHGAIVYAAARSENTLDKIAIDLEKKYDTTIIPVYFDIKDTGALKEVFIKINKEQRRLDCIVNNAGVMEDALIGMVTDQNLRETFEVNVYSIIHIIQFAMRLMKKNNSGSIINISSIVGANGNPGQLVYSASKGAVISITKTAAKELAGSNIRVNAIAPGMINTDMFRSIGEERVATMKSKIGMQRLGTPDEIANAAVFLASDMSEYITGQVIGVDGGAII